MMRCRTRSTTALLLLILATTLSAEDLPQRLAPGAALFEAADFDQALEFFRSVSPGTDAAWVDYYKGWIHLQQGDTDDAIELLQKAVEANPASSLFHRRLGDAYVQKIDEVGMLKKMGFAKKARTNYEQAVELAPDDIDARESLTGFYLNAPAVAGGSRTKAEEQVAEMRRLDPAKGHQLMGRVYMEEEEWDKAVVEFQSALDGGQKNSDTYYSIGFSYQQGERYREAFAAFENAIDVDPESLGSYYQIGRTAIFSTSNLERAVECLSFYLKQPQQRNSPAAEHAHWRLGMIYELMDRDDRAAAEYRAALELDPDHKEAKKALKDLS